jgi:hypothetical protein
MIISMTRKPRRLGEMLVEQSICDLQQIEDGLAYQKTRNLQQIEDGLAYQEFEEIRIGEALVLLGHASQTEVTQTLARQLEEKSLCNEELLYDGDPLLAPYLRDVQLAFFWGGIVLLIPGSFAFFDTDFRMIGWGCLALGVLGLLTAFWTRSSSLYIHSHGITRLGIGGWSVAWDDIDVVRIDLTRKGQDREMRLGSGTEHLTISLKTHRGPNRKIRGSAVHSLRQIARTIQAGVEQTGGNSRLRGHREHWKSLLSESPVSLSTRSSASRVFSFLVVFIPGFILFLLFPSYLPLPESWGYFYLALVFILGLRNASPKFKKDSIWKNFREVMNS